MQATGESRWTFLQGLDRLNNLLSGLKLSSSMQKCFDMKLKCHKRGGADLTGAYLFMVTTNNVCLTTMYFINLLFKCKSNSV